MKTTPRKLFDKTYHLPLNVKLDRKAVEPRCPYHCPTPISAINENVNNYVPYTAVMHAAPPRRKRGHRQLHILQRQTEALLLMIESQKDASLTRTVLAAALLRSTWEEIKDTGRRTYAGDQSHKLDPRDGDDNPRFISPEEERNVRADRQKGKAKSKGRGWQYSWQPEHQQPEGKGGRGEPW